MADGRMDEESVGKRPNSAPKTCLACGGFRCPAGRLHMGHDLIRAATAFLIKID
jgi:hypothetical protein